MFKNKNLLITGGTGSFGKTILNRFINSEINEIRIFSRDEKKQDKMRHQYKNDKIKFYIGDIRNKRSLDSAMSGVDYVFHAAALKQVPSCEFFPIEAVQTNILGTENVLDSAISFGVKKIIVLSTDKACYPINAMGISKAMMEKVAIAKGRSLGKNSSTTICCTRYGNVIASRGSVLPLFIDQIKKEENLTVTDPEMSRFMMTLEDAVDLVIYAWTHGVNGDIFVQKSPSSTIENLANALILLTKSKVKVDVIGTRHGEKLYETLVTREEMSKSEDLGRYFRIPCDDRNLNYDKFFTEGENLINVEDYHSHNTKNLDIDELVEILSKLRIIQEEINTLKVR